MAKYSTKGMTVDSILNMDNKTFNSLDLNALKAVTSKLNSAANKRITRLEEKGVNSPALASVQASGGRFSTKNKTLNELRSEYARAKNFMNLKSSSVTGWKQVRRETIQILRRKGIDVNMENFDEVIRIYERLKELDPSVTNKRFKYLVMEETSKLDSSMSFNQKLEVMRQNLTSLYEEQAEMNNEINSVSEFFEI